MIRRRETRIQFLVIVNLPVGGHDDIAVATDQRLRSGLGIHDGESFVGDAVGEGDGGGIGGDDDVAAPIGTAVAEFGGAFDEVVAEVGGVEGGGEDGEDAAHDVDDGFRAWVLSAGDNMVDDWIINVANELDGKMATTYRFVLSELDDQSIDDDRCISNVTQEFGVASGFRSYIAFTYTCRRTNYLLQCLSF
jgi:hypothetical protein